MIRIIVSLFTLTITAIVSAQIADPHVLASSGSEGVNAELKMEWTMGEFGVGVGGNNYYHFTAGFHQPDPLPDGVGLVEIAPSHGNLLFWPNPAADIVRYRFDGATSDAMDITVFDEKGSTVLTTTQGRGVNEGTLQVAHLVPGTYLVLFSSQGSQARTIVRFSKVH